jgi:hypothetical protein
MIEKTIERHGRLAGLLARRRIASLTRVILERLLPAPSSDRRLSIEERIAIGPKQTLLLVNCIGRHFLMATAGNSVTSIIEVQPMINERFDCADAVNRDRQEARL